MSSSQLLVLVVLLGASSAACAADSPAPERQPELIVPSVADLYLDTGPATGQAAPRKTLSERKHDRPDAGVGSMSPLKMRLGRTPAGGRSPGDAPPLYGEVGIDLNSGAGLSLVPSYRVVLPDADATAESEASAAQVLKLGARIRF